MKLDARYLAGFFDGEGNVGIYAGGGTGRTLRVQITQVISPEATALLTSLRDEWGGSLCRFNRTLTRAAWNWQVGGEGAWRFLMFVEPHLIFKREQAQLAMIWFKTRPSLTRDPKNGRKLPRVTADIALSDRVAELLRSMKRGSQDADDLVEIRHTLHQLINVKGD